MSVPALSGVPADTLYVKYGAVSPQNQASDVRKKYTSTPLDGRGLQTWRTSMTAQPFRMEQQMRTATFHHLIKSIFPYFFLFSGAKQICKAPLIKRQQHVDRNGGAANIKGKSELISSSEACFLSCGNPPSVPISIH